MSCYPRNNRRSALLLSLLAALALTLPACHQHRRPHEPGHHPHRTSHHPHRPSHRPHEPSHRHQKPSHDSHKHHESGKHHQPPRQTQHHHRTEPPNSHALANEPMLNVAELIPNIVIDLRYTTADNFVGEQLYPTNSRCLLRKSAALRLKRVQDRLAKQNLGLKVYDGFRPLSVQKKMWKIMPDPRYVADPKNGSRHNRGSAVDVTLVDANGKELEMPCPFDTLTEAAHRDNMNASPTAIKNRQTLEQAMQAEGFIGLNSEWWHFDDPNWKHYPITNTPLTN